MASEVNLAKAARLRQARELDGRYEHAAPAARALKLSEPTYQSHENACRGFSHKRAVHYADFYKVSLEWLLTGRGTPYKSLAPITGLVGTNGEITQPERSDMTEPQPQGRKDCVAAMVNT